VVYHGLDVEHIASIAKIQLQQLQDRQAKMGLESKFAPRDRIERCATRGSSASRRAEGQRLGDWLRLG